jgi:hypothetical protein
MELNELTEKIIGCAYEVSNTLGSGFPESVYEKALHYQTMKTGLQAERQFQNVAQAMNYLKASGMPICLLMNFGRPKIEIRRFVPYDVWKENKPHHAARQMR